MEGFSWLMYHWGVLLALFASADILGYLFFQSGQELAGVYDALHEGAIASLSAAMAFVYFFKYRSCLVRL